MVHVQLTSSHTGVEWFGNEATPRMAFVEAHPVILNQGRIESHTPLKLLQPLWLLMEQQVRHMFFCSTMLTL